MSIGNYGWQKDVSIVDFMRKQKGVLPVIMSERKGSLCLPSARSLPQLDVEVPRAALGGSPPPSINAPIGEGKGMTTGVDLLQCQRTIPHHIPTRQDHQVVFEAAPLMRSGRYEGRRGRKSEAQREP